jgi:hypothetical protein
VVRGLHGLHIYATEHWIDYLLAAAADNNNTPSRARFFKLSCELTEALRQESEETQEHEREYSRPEGEDHRLAALMGIHRGLYTIAKDLLHEQRNGQLTAGSQNVEEGTLVDSTLSSQPAIFNP